MFEMDAPMQKIVILAYLLLSSTTLFAQEIYRASDESVLRYMERDLNTGSHWYGGYYTDADGTDHKLGYASISYSEIKSENNKNLFLINYAFSFNFNVLGFNYETLIVGKDLYNAEPPFKLLTQQTDTISSDMVEHSFTFLKDKTLDYTKIANGIRSSFSQKYIEITLKDFYSTDEWVEKPSRKIDDAMYTHELSEGKLTKSKFTITNIKNQIVDGINYQYFELLSPLGDDKDASDFYVYRDSKNWIKLSMDFGANFFVDFRLEPEERAKDSSNLADLYILNSIFVTEESKKFINYYGDEDTNAKSVWYEIIGDDNGIIEPSYPSQFIKETDDGKRFLITGYSSDEVHNENFEYEAVKEEAYAEAQQFKLDNPKLAAISTKLVDAAQSHTNDWSVEEEVIGLIRTFVSDYIEDEYIYFEVTDPYIILEDKKGDCTEHADLFNALLKAAGIPARNASGYLLADDSGAFSGHAWSEVAYDGVWVPVDATWDVWVENSVNHLKTVKDISLSTKNFKLKLHKIEYHDGSSAMYN